jgi:hypothetical protein
MPKNLRIKLNSAGVKALLQSPEMQGIIGKFASAKASQAGTGYAYNVKVGKSRTYANIYAETDEAKKDNFENNTLEKVIRS